MPSILEALQDFAASVTAKMTQLTSGEPEDQLRNPFETFMEDVANHLGWNVVCTGETPLPDRLGRPDFAVHVNGLLAGYVELKAHGTGVRKSKFRGHNRRQFARFESIPNLLYTDGNEWALYRNGEIVGKMVRLDGDISADGKQAATSGDAHALEGLLRVFFLWQPFIPKGRGGKIDLPGFAKMLAPLCRLLRDDVTDALRVPDSPLVQLAADWRKLLFPEASDEQFADAYAQTVTFALLLGRAQGADPLTLGSAEKALAARHALLSRALEVLTDPTAQREMPASLALLLRVIAMVPPATLSGPEDPWLYFYEDFLAAYDPDLRKNAGAYYTPVQVVHCMIRLVDDLLVNQLEKPMGFVDSGVVTLDPAVGTGTFLLGVIEHALKRVEAEQGPGAVPGQASALAENLYGFELMVGPYAVTQLRMSRALQDRGAELPEDGPRTYLTDTLENPHGQPSTLPLFLKPISDQHEKALKVKSNVPVLVCLGNPPYDRHQAATSENRAQTGGWVRWGNTSSGADSIFQGFLKPAIDAGHAVHVKNLYNLYVYFWRWALWKVFEANNAPGPGVICFISASSYLDGDAFAGMREHMRRQCEEIWILDLGGEGRGTRREDNVFAIQTPVAVAVAVRTRPTDPETPARVRYARIEGSRGEKLATLDAIRSFADVEWQDCPADWQRPFRPEGKGDYFAWPLLTDLMPWQQSGVKSGRTWVISPDEESLKTSWRVLVNSKKEERQKLFKDSPSGRKVHESAAQLPPSSEELGPVSEIKKNCPPPKTIQYGFRYLDRQFIFFDSRFIDRPSPALWTVGGIKQIFITSLLHHPLGGGPAVSASANIPDLHHFRGSYGGKDVLPLFRSSDASQANILPGLLDMLAQTYHRRITPADFLAYVYGILAQPAFTERFSKELETRELRVPITKHPDLFDNVRAKGALLLWLHTYGERYVPDGQQPGRIPPGAAKCIKPIPSTPEGYPESFGYDESNQTLHVGEGEFAPVSMDLFGFDVSGLKVVQSWLKYRMKEGAGRKSSPLDDIRPERWTHQFTTELLNLLWVLEATLAEYPEQARLLEAVLAGECFRADELPEVPEEMRKPPKSSRRTSQGELPFG